MPRAAEAMDALAIRGALGAVAREVVEGQAAKCDLEHPVAAPQNPEMAMHTGPRRELGLARVNGERRPGC